MRKKSCFPKVKKTEKVFCHANLFFQDVGDKNQVEICIEPKRLSWKMSKLTSSLTTKQQTTIRTINSTTFKTWFKVR